MMNSLINMDLRRLMINSLAEAINDFNQGFSKAGDNSKVGALA